jgi:hypothetical protein
MELEYTGLEYTLRKQIENMMKTFSENPDDLDLLKGLAVAVNLGNQMPFQLKPWAFQNIYFEMMHTVLPERRWKAEHGDAEAREWVEIFVDLGNKLSVRVD